MDREEGWEMWGAGREKRTDEKTKMCLKVWRQQQLTPKCWKKMLKKTPCIKQLHYSGERLCELMKEERMIKARQQTGGREMEQRQDQSAGGPKSVIPSSSVV